MEKVIRRLFEMQDLQYRDFSAKLIPAVDREHIIGVRSPALKSYMKEFTHDDDKYLFLKELPHRYLEENNLHAGLVAMISKDINVVLSYVEDFLPYIDNWATCDTFSPKIFKRYPETVYERILQWLKSEHVYTVRFAIVIMLQYYLDEQFKPEMLNLIASVESDEYYVNMAKAWYFSYALIKQYDTALPLFEKKSLDKWIHNKSIRKAIESYRISDDRKQYLKSLKK